MAEEVVLPRFVTQAPHPLRALLVGNSGSGKSTFISQLIGNKDQVFPRPGYVKFVYCSPNLNADYASPEDSSFQQRLRRLAEPVEIVFEDHVPTYDEVLQHAEVTRGRILIFFDDFSQQLFSTDLIFHLFTRLSSHQSIDSCVTLHQGLSAGKAAGRWHDLVFSNANFLVIFQNIADRQAVSTMSRRIFPGGKNHLARCLAQATRIMGSYAHIIVDANLKNPLNARFGVRTNLFQERGRPLLLFKNPQDYH